LPDCQLCAHDFGNQAPSERLASPRRGPSPPALSKRTYIIQGAASPVKMGIKSEPLGAGNSVRHNQ
jgi:hypothetical protein